MTTGWMKPPVLIVAGPTASGKSAFALDVAVEFSGTVINADSMQVYRDLRILTARPAPEMEAQAPHRLFGFLSATERCSAGRWLALATEEIRAAWTAGRLPVVVGGTGLYLKALQEGLSPVPVVPDEIRAEARALHDQIGGKGMQVELARLDPEAAGRLPVGDRQRLIRAYEVARATGRPLSEWQALGWPRPPLDAAFLVIALVPPNPQLYPAIDARFDRMVEQGAVDEVAAFERLTLDPSLPAARALGVRELACYLRGETTFEAALEEAKRRSRNYAKRQKTWLRTQIVISATANEKYSERVKEKIFPFIRNSLLTTQF